MQTRGARTFPARCVDRSGSLVTAHRGVETGIGEARAHRVHVLGLRKGPTRTRCTTRPSASCVRCALAWMPDSASRALRLSASEGFSNEPDLQVHALVALAAAGGVPHRLRRGLDHRRGGLLRRARRRRHLHLGGGHGDDLGPDEGTLSPCGRMLVELEILLGHRAVARLAGQRRRPLRRPAPARAAPPARPGRDWLRVKYHAAPAAISAPKTRPMKIPISVPPALLAGARAGLRAGLRSRLTIALPASHRLGRGHAQHRQTGDQHLAHCRGEREAGELDRLVLDQHALGVVPAVEVGGEVL